MNDFAFNLLADIELQTEIEIKMEMYRKSAVNRECVAETQNAHATIECEDKFCDWSTCGYR